MKTSAVHIATPFVTFIVSVIGGGVLGALTNFINAWVGNSILGAQFGGFALLILWIVVFGLKWKDGARKRHP